MALPSQQMFGGARGLAPYRPFYEQPPSTSNSVGGVVNRYLGKYAASLKSPEEQEAFEEAKRLRRDNQAALARGNSAALLAGGGNWREFDDYTAIRKQTEALLGRRFSMDGIDGGGDINQRPLNGLGDTRQVNAPQLDSKAAAGLSGASGMYDPRESVSDYQRRQETADLALQALRRRDRVGQHNLEMDLLGASEDLQFAPGTPNAYNRRDMTDAQNLDFGIRRGRANSQLASENFWQREEPIARYKSGQQEDVLDRASDRAIKLQDTKNAGALATAAMKVQQARTKEEFAQGMAELRALTQRANNMTQYGQDTTAIDQEMWNRIQSSAVTPADGPGAEGIRGDYVGHTVSDGQTTWKWNGRDWDPVR